MNHGPDPFEYVAPDDEQTIKYQAVASNIREAYQAILRNAPRCAERTLAIRHLQYARMMANAAIAFKGEAIET